MRKIMTYNTGTGAFTVEPNWETTPDATTTYDVLLPEGVTLGMLKTLNPTTSGRTVDVTATGAVGVDWGNVENPTTAVTLSGTTIDVDQVVASVSGNVDGNVTGSVGSVAAGGIAATSFAAGAIDAAAIGANAIGAAEIADGAIDAATFAAGAIDAAALAADIITDIWQGTALTESYAADGAAATPAQLLYLILAMFTESSISGTTLTAKKLDGVTTAATFTLDDATDPTSITRAT